MKRSVIEEALDREECEKLVHIARAYSSVGYRECCTAVLLEVLMLLNPSACLPIVR